MSPAVRFLMLVVIGWGAVRYATAGAPGSAVFGFTDDAPAAVPQIIPTQFPPIEPLASPATAPAPAPQYYPIVPYYVTAAAPRLSYVYPPPPAAYYQSSPPIPARPLLDFASTDANAWPLGHLASTVYPPLRSAPAPTPAVAQVPAVPAKLDRLQLTTWALLRERNGSPTLASGGTLGGSQAGARLTYAINRSLAGSLRTTSPIGGRGAEVAVGIRYRPLRSIPLWVTAERRQAFGRDGGRSAFALLAEGGVYQLPMPASFRLDGYAQAGIVGVRSRDLFADGGFTVTRPFYKQYSAGFGIWGGVQPGLHRVDAGPRLSMPVRNMRVHLDWRQRLIGNAAPGSGPALTLAGDF